MIVRLELKDDAGRIVGASWPIKSSRTEYRAAVARLARDVEMSVFGPEGKVDVPGSMRVPEGDGSDHG